MRRKLIPQGLGGFTIYLPKKWVDKKHLGREDSVEIREVGPDLLIKAETMQIRSITISIGKEDADWDMKILLVHAYRKDFDHIIIKSEIPLDLGLIEKTVTQSMLGFALTKKTEHEVEIENISEPSGEKYEAVLRRVFLLNRETISTLQESFSSGKESFKQIGEYREQLDKYVLFCKRILYKERYEHDPLLHWELLTFLMHINHTLYYFAQHAKKASITQHDELARILEELSEYYGLQYDAFYKRDFSHIKEINQKKEKHHFGELLDAMEKSTGAFTVALSYLREVFRLIQIGTSPIVAELLEKQLK